ncbi:MAG: GTP cyclohydrolase I FolE2 [Desulfobulbaceae bacterium]|jgi:GTP cyclohydrolase I|nr:GTP cyclohydrolase I FolE2 [Desulfobulbaceae bacterium]
MNTSKIPPMKDIQNQIDHRRIDIRKVGVKTVSYPITLRDKAKKEQNTIATLNMYVNLPHRFKGTHMSRFIEILNEFHGKIDIRNFHGILEKMKERLDAEASHVEMEFPYFFTSDGADGSLALRQCMVTMLGSLAETSDIQFKLMLPIILPRLAQTGGNLPRLAGHWGRVEVTVRFKGFIWIEDLLSHIEKGIEAEVAALAPGDHKALSVEALVTRIGESLSSLPEVARYSILVENLGAGYSTFATLKST